MGPIRCPETSVPKYKHMLPNIPEKWRSHLYREGHLTSFSFAVRHEDYFEQQSYVSMKYINLFVLQKLHKYYIASCVHTEVKSLSPLLVSLVIYEDARYNVSSYDSMLAVWLAFVNIFCQLVSNWLQIKVNITFHLLHETFLLYALSQLV